MARPSTTRSFIAVLTSTLGLVASQAGADPAGLSPAPHFDQPLTLVQLTDLALSNNPATKIAWADVRNSDAGVELARAGYWPRITLAYDYQKQKIPAGTSGAAASQTLYGPSVDLSWLLFDFGTRSGSVDAAKYSRTAAELDANQTLQDLVLQVEQ